MLTTRLTAALLLHVSIYTSAAPIDTKRGEPLVAKDVPGLGHGLNVSAAGAPHCSRCCGMSSADFLKYKCAAQQKELRDGMSWAQKCSTTACSECAKCPRSIRNPDPTKLKWVKQRVSNSGHTVLTGYLTVPLSYQPTDPGYGIDLKLRVSAVIPKGNDANLPVILKHCGGPGSTDSCAYGGRNDAWKNKYNFLGIAQRGIGPDDPDDLWPSWDPLPTNDGSTAVGNKFPMLGNAVNEFCGNKRTYSEAAGKYQRGEIDVVKFEDLTTCECDVPHDGVEIPASAEYEIDPYDETAMAKYIAFKAHQNSRCLTETDVFKIYHPDRPDDAIDFTQYVGTQMLAQDLNVFREAIGADKLGCDGGSYGTAVCSSWVAAFPQHAGKLLLNGNVASEPGVDDYFMSVAISMRQLMTKLIKICRGVDCFGDDVVSPTEEFAKLMKTIDDDNTNKYAAKDRAGKMFKLTSPQVYSFMVRDIEGGKGQYTEHWVAKIRTVQDLKSNDDGRRSKAVQDMLCGGLDTWKYFGSCVRGLVAGGYSTNIVRAADYSSRFSVHAATQLYKNLARNYDNDPVSVSRAMQKAGQLLTWPTEPTPATYGARASVPGIILSSLYDGATPYVNSKRMRDTLPSTSLVTWQGVGHCVRRADYDPEGVERCLAVVAEYFLEDKLPIDGFTCRNTEKIVKEEHLNRLAHVARVRAARQQQLKLAQ